MGHLPFMQQQAHACIVFNLEIKRDSLSEWQLV